MVEQNAPIEGPADAPASAASAMSGNDSLTDDIRHLVGDGRTYLEAELQYQKSRAALVLDRSKSGAIYGAVAAVFGHLALIALVVGLVIALAPLITAWGATALVAGLLLVVALLFARMARRKFASISAATAGKPS